TAWLGWCCSKVFINGVDAWTGSKMQCGLDLRVMLALRLIAESECEAVFDLLRFIQKQIDESGSHDGSENDL
ncbi:hypothetical protein Tco_0702650, partial [Tanacetum coccineum]